MTEQLISFETAKLAKEKGYIDMSYPVYSYDGFKILSYTNSMNVYPCSTQSLLQKWLREKHNIEVNPCHSCNGEYDLWTNNGNLLQVNGLYKNYKTYEEALEQGLQEALKLIK